MLQAFNDERFSNYFYFDVMAKGAYPEYMIKYWKERKVQVQMEEGDLELLKETRWISSFSYYASQVASEDESLEITVGNMAGAVYANPYLEKSDFGWTMVSEGLRIQLNKMYDRYGLPIFITENGLGCF